MMGIQMGEDWGEDQGRLLDSSLLLIVWTQLGKLRRQTGWSSNLTNLHSARDCPLMVSIIGGGTYIPVNVTQDTYTTPQTSY
jgi:hypothetical protein